MEAMQRLIAFLSSEPSISAFWGPLASGAIVAYFSVLLTRRRDNKKTENVLTIRIVKEEYTKHIIEIKNLQPSSLPAQSRASSKPSNDELPVALGAGLLLLTFFYAKFQAEIILTILGLSTFLLAYLGVTILLSLKKNISHGNDWKLFFSTTFGLLTCAYPLMYLALHPLYFPERIESMASLATDSGVVTLLKTYGIAGLGFLLFQALGFITLASAQLIQLLSLTFYTTATQIVLSDHKRPFLELVARGTNRFSRPNVTTWVSVFLYLLSTVLISGLAYQWWYNR